MAMQTRLSDIPHAAAVELVRSCGANSAGLGDLGSWLSDAFKGKSNPLTQVVQIAAPIVGSLVPGVGTAAGLAVSAALAAAQKARAMKDAKKAAEEASKQYGVDVATIEKLMQSPSIQSAAAAGVVNPFSGGTAPAPVVSKPTPQVVPVSSGSGVSKAPLMIGAGLGIGLVLLLLLRK